ncbi:MAG: hypothetical protein ABSB74_21110 [Tepidisphaeraceae bacterium]
MHAWRRYPDGAGFRRFHSSGNHWLIWLIGVAGRLVNNCVKYRCGSMPCRRQVLVQLERIAAIWPPRSLFTNKLFFQLCGAPHNRKNWMFARHDKSAQGHAILWSLIANA